MDTDQYQCSLPDDESAVDEMIITTNGPAGNLHYFQVNTFRSPTVCGVCQRLLWGLRKQGVCCSICRLNCHRKCAQRADITRPCILASDCMPPTPPNESDGQSITGGSNSSSSDGGDIMESSAAINTRESLEVAAVQPPHYNVHSSSLIKPRRLSTVVVTTTATNASVTPSPSLHTTHSILRAIDEQQRQRRRYSSCIAQSSASATFKTDHSSGKVSLIRPVGRRSLAAIQPSPSESSIPSPSTPSFKMLLQTTAAKAADIKGSPPLNVFTTLPKNFTRFVMKVGPLAEFQDRIEEIFLWRNPTETFAAMVVYVVICLNPLLLLLCPHLLAFGVIWRNYYRHHSITKSHTIVAESNTSEKHQNIASQRPRQKTVNPLLLRPDQISYSKNMQFIQNTMGMYSDAYEQYRVMCERIDWSDDKFVGSMIRGWILSALAIIICHPYIPWRFVMISAGLAAFMANTAVGLAFRSYLLDVKHVKVLLWQLWKPMEEAWQRLRNKSPDKLLSQQKSSTRQIAEVDGTVSCLSNMLVVECFENQRYWAGLGWIPHMLHSERKPWSDRSGGQALRSREEYKQPGELIHTKSMVYESNLPDSLAIDSSCLPVDVAWHWHPDSTWTVDVEWIKGLPSGDSLLIDQDGWLYSDHKWQLQRKTSKRCLTRQRRWIRVAQGVQFN